MIGNRLKSLGLAGLFLVAIPAAASAQPFDFPPAAAGDTAALSRAMPGLAERVIAVYKEGDRDRYLDNLFRLQTVAGRYAEADKTLTSLRELRRTADPRMSPATNVQYQIYARAKAAEAAGKPFEEAFRQAFRETLGPLDDRTSALVMRALGVDPFVLQLDLSQALERQKAKSAISLADALGLIRAYQVERAYESIAPLAAPLIAEDDQRRYVIDRDLQVRTPEGATVCVMVVRPRAASGRLTALLNFTIYANPVTLLSEARRTASNGYAGVEGLTRGKGCSPDAPVPYEHDGTDAAAVIDWISRQAWSDGRVGMYGGSYEGFTQWAAAKHMPKALKALMPSVTVAPGIDVPMEGNVFQSFVYSWPFYAATGKGLDDKANNDRARWRKLNRDWYTSGRSYRSLDKIDGTPNPLFDRWLEHPSYDDYWQRMIPFGKEFAKIDIPVLTTTGYYDGGMIGALYYLAEHYKHDPHAEHYLVIGPYDHVSGQRGTARLLGGWVENLNGYQLDAAARLDLGELRYQWFNHVFKGGPKPALLKDRINYEVMGADEWKHAPSLDAMGNRSLKLHLSSARSGDMYRLSEEKPPGDSFLSQRMDFADRSDVDRISPGGGIVDKDLDTWGSLAFVSDPFPKPTEVSGLFSGELDFKANKKDLDVWIGLYERMPSGEYFQLSTYMARASYAKDRSHRQLLTPGKRQQLPFKSGRLTSRKFAAGSRLVVLLGIPKDAGTQINYGTGKDVSDESIADAKEPLQIEWYGDSFIVVPVWR
ncbi:MAG TPA: CocE/NonD family hydrolase [Thermoanaerobaculia bacterium]|nr:CocE/NonD family hydrolase [Thermoanaerobaculia bacterium]